MGKLFNTPVMLLFDTGASHSFISTHCVTTLKLGTKQSEHRIEVSFPIGGRIEISRTCSNLEITLSELKIVANNLSVMIMWDMDIILGMDRLAENHATILCKKRHISFRTPEGEATRFHRISMGTRKSVISMLQASKPAKKECLAYFVYLNKEKKEERKLEEVEIAREFPDVFPDTLPGLPPDRKAEFTIDLEPGSALYRRHHIEWPQGNWMNRRYNCKNSWTWDSSDPVSRRAEHMYCLLRTKMGP
ncbi:uncharacterized protein LOC121775467 [Salvia splendens]|uniref:uncharacterized protein LOC121775467 n=1 Tax=Salvia splendens TaxID=180675 RepID=UPI001C25979E|nr:uncharacterized protein LOC121775467 [Salvia splendens]